jgi:hypothetical protein
MRRLQAGDDAPATQGPGVGRACVIDLEGNGAVTGNGVDPATDLVQRQVRRGQGELVAAQVDPPPAETVALVQFWLGTDR